MNQLKRFYSIVVCSMVLMVVGLSTTNGQTTAFNVLYETSFNNRPIFLTESNGYIAWVSDIENIVYRWKEGVLENRILPQAYLSCNSREHLYIDNNFLHYKIGGDTNTAFCDQGFVWGTNSVELELSDIGEITTIMQQLILAHKK